MLLRAAFFVLMALGLIGFGTVAWMTMRPAEVAPAQAPVAVASAQAMLVAAHALHAGSLLKPEDLAAKPLTGDAAEATLDTPDARRSLVGAMIRRPMAAGEALRTGDLLKPGDHGFLAAVLDPGSRAVTIPVDAASGLAGLIWPGDRVDLILTQSSGDASVPLGKRVGAETVLTNVRVIAIDQQMMQGGGGSGEGGARTVTLEVDANQAQRVAVAMRLGQLSLSVRSANSDASSRGKEAAGNVLPTWAKDVLPSMLTENKAPNTATIRVFGGTRDVKEFSFP